MLNKKLLSGLAGITLLGVSAFVAGNAFAQGAPSAEPCAFPQNIEIGDSGEYVRCLQNYLILHDYLDRKKAGTVYDEATHAAFTTFRTDLKLGGTNATPVYMLPFVTGKGNPNKSK
jgi:hypothetical protein